MSKSARLDRIEKRLALQQPKQAYIILMAPGQFCEGWLVTSARNDERLLNGQWVTVADPEVYATREETYATKEQALDAIDQATTPGKPLILITDEQVQKCL